ncbi:ditrans,polycis-polyprenyl diphosphate synthase [(2E,6E)-farnesyl], partial [Sarracenia purpurea var. burkii]
YSTTTINRSSQRQQPCDDVSVTASNSTIITMDVGDEQQKVFCSPGQFGNFVLLLLWHILHFIISIWYCVLGIAHVLESYLASSGLLKRYGVVNLDKLRYLAVVVDNDEAYQTSKVTELLQWLAVVGVKNVCLYDAEGVLKKSKEAILGKLHVAKLFKETTKNVPLLDQQQIHLEFASYSDGKEAVAKAANLLFVKYYLGRDQEEPIFTESHIAEALGTVGSEGPDPDLILIYGPARCHLGFPAWRIRYTEIVHMGPLKTMKYGSLIKALEKFTMVRQNYGK